MGGGQWQHVVAIDDVGGAGCNRWPEGVATDGRGSVATNGRQGGVATDGQGSVATNGRRGGVATDGRKVLQPTFKSGRCCNGWAEGVATNGRGGTGKMQQDVAIFHGGWTTMNDATAIYGSYRKSCNKVPCTLR